MNPPPNPHAVESRAAMKAHNAQLPKDTPRTLEHFYPLDVMLPLWRHSCNDGGVTLWIDDPASLFSGTDLRRT